MKKNTKYFTVFLLPSFIGLCLFVLFPFLDVWKRSFQSVSTDKFVGINNYHQIFENEAFQLAIKNTMLFTAVCIPLLVLIGFVLSILMQKVVNNSFLKAIYLFPLAIPTASFVLIWKMTFYQNGWLNGLLSKIFGDVSIDFLGSGVAFWVLVISYIWKNLGYTIILWLAGLSMVSKEMLEAAKSDGANELQLLIRIIIPNLKGSLYTIVILSFLNSFKIYREAYLVAGAYPHKSIYLLQHLFNNWFVNLEFNKMAAAAVVTGAFLIGCNLFMQYLWDRD